MSGAGTRRQQPGRTRGYANQSGILSSDYVVEEDAPDRESYVEEKRRRRRRAAALGWWSCIGVTVILALAIAILIMLDDHEDDSDSILTKLQALANGSSLTLSELLNLTENAANATTPCCHQCNDTDRARWSCSSVFAPNPSDCAQLPYSLLATGGNSSLCYWGECVYFKTWGPFAPFQCNGADNFTDLGADHCIDMISFVYPFKDRLEAKVMCVNGTIPVCVYQDKCAYFAIVADLPPATLSIVLTPVGDLKKRYVDDLGSSKDEERFEGDMSEVIEEQQRKRRKGIQSSSKHVQTVKEVGASSIVANVSDYINVTALQSNLTQYWALVGDSDVFMWGANEAAKLGLGWTRPPP